MPPLRFRVHLRLLSTESGGRNGPLFTDYRPNWNLKNSWHGHPSINDGRVLLEGIERLAPGEEGPAIIEPLAEEFWGEVDVGTILPMQEGRRVVGFATVTDVVSRPDHFTREVAAFINQAHQYCDFIKRLSEFDSKSRLAASRIRLLELYRAGSDLPHVKAPDGFAAGPPPGMPANWPGFAEFELYWEVFNPYTFEAPVTGSLSDDLLDIYFDVSRGLELWKSRAPPAATIWEWRFAFDSHWGDHAIDALRALHRACRDQ